MSRGSMTMRASIQRDPDLGTDDQKTDDWGQDKKPQRSPFPAIPCRAWSKSRVEHVDVGKRAVVEDLRAIVPFDADVKRDDRLTIIDRLGALIFDGPVAVLTKTRRGATSSSPGHVELMLERHK